MTARRIDVEKFCSVCAKRFGADQDFTHCPYDGEVLLPVKHDPLIGKVIGGKFEILEFVGAGGWSQVYRARDVKLGRLVAFKILRAELASTSEKLLRFEREARIISSLNHPHICAVYDYGTIENGQPYLVLEYLVGQTVAQWLEDSGAVEPATALKIMKQAANALSAAHAKGVIHRDLKPGNLMVLGKCGEEKVKIIDFGLARTFESVEEHLLTHTGLTIGTPMYMSPEQVRGGVLDARSDIYSFGCVFYEMLLGTSPISGGNTFEIMQNHLEVSPVMSDPESKIPGPLKEITLNCLHKDPCQRYQSMHEVEADLTSFESSGHIPRRKKPWMRGLVRHKLKASAAVIALCAVATFPAWSRMVPYSVLDWFGDHKATHPASSAADSGLQQLQDAVKSDQPDKVDEIAKRLVAQLQSEGKSRSVQMLLVSQTAAKYFADKDENPLALPYIKCALVAQEAASPRASDDYLRAYREGVASLISCKEPVPDPYLLQLLSLTEAKYGPDSRETCQALESLFPWTINRDFRVSEKRLQRLLALQEKYYDAHDYEYVHALQRLSWVQTNLGESEKARTYAEKALNLATDKMPPRIREDLLSDAALAEKKCHKYDEAIGHLRSAESVAQKVDAPDADKIQGDLGRCLFEAKRYKEAEPILRDALKRLEKTWGTDTATYRLCLSAYVDLLKQTSRTEQAALVESTGKVH